MYRGTSLIKDSPPSYGHRRALGMFVLQGPKGAPFLMIEVPLYPRAFRAYQSRDALERAHADHRRRQL